jgi:hypothetical protein
LPRVF